MNRIGMKFLSVAMACALAVAGGASARGAETGAQAQTRSVVLAGGCFWGMEAVFEHVKGVEDVVSGYAGGGADAARYERVSRGDTGHAESVKIEYRPAEVSLATLLDVYFTIAHDPTQIDGQGPDRGPQYRSAVFYADGEQRKEAAGKIAEWEARHVFARPLATRLEKLAAFYPAEDEHQNYAARHPYQPYIVINDRPRLERLKKIYPALYKE